MKLRSAQVQDADELTRLFEQLGYVCTPSELKERIASRVDHIHNEIFVAEVEGAIVGAIAFSTLLPIHEPGKWGLISALVVNESIRGKGIGDALLAHTEHHAKKSGCTQIELSSSESRKKAHAFYEKNGFVEKRKRFLRLLAA
jgi:GNAT superfamily N-acetyltransferase